MDPVASLLFPVFSFMEIPVKDFHSIVEYPDRWLCFALYLGTAVWATYEAWRLKFSEYRLNGVVNAPATFAGCFCLWSLFFPWFLVNRWKVLDGKVQSWPESQRRKSSSAGAWLSILICGGISLLFTATALPSMVQSIVKANSATAVSSLAEYRRAQETIRAKNRIAKEAGNNENAGFVDNFRNLHYSVDMQGNPVSLIGKKMADAFAAPPKGRPTRENAPIESTPYKGYVFHEDPYLTEHSLWNENFALVAYPVYPGRTGFEIYWVDSKGDVKYHRLPSGAKELELIKPGDSPLNPRPAIQWEDL